MWQWPIRFRHHICHSYQSRKELLLNVPPCSKMQSTGIGEKPHIPLACEVTGVWCQKAVEIFQELRRRISEVTGDKRDTSFLFQRLSIIIALQKANAACMLGSFPIRTPFQTSAPPIAGFSFYFIILHWFHLFIHPSGWTRGIEKRIIIIWFGDIVTVTHLTKCDTNSKVRAMSA